MTSARGSHEELQQVGDELVYDATSAISESLVYDDTGHVGETLIHKAHEANSREARSPARRERHTSRACGSLLLAGLCGFALGAAAILTLLRHTPPSFWMSMVTQTTRTEQGSLPALPPSSWPPPPPPPLPLRPAPVSAVASPSSPAAARPLPAGYGSMVDALNHRWTYAHPAGDLAAAGLLVHACEAAEFVPTDTGKAMDWSHAAPTPRAWPRVNLSNLCASSGRKHAASSIISKSHPDIYQCPNKLCPSEWRYAAALVLSPSPQVQERVRCAGWRDIDSYQWTCDEGEQAAAAGASCVAGCPPAHDWRWCETHGWENQPDCSHSGVDRKQCCLVWRPEHLYQMRHMQDQQSASGHAAMWGWNEVTLDRTSPWDLRSMIDAVVIAPQASHVALAHAKALHRELLRVTSLTEESLPFLKYDATKPTNPFFEC